MGYQVLNTTTSLLISLYLVCRVERVEVKDVRLPQQLQRAMAAEAEATRQARAKVIEAEGEQKASKALKEASDIISSSGAALQLRYNSKFYKLVKKLP